MEFDIYFSGRVLAGHQQADVAVTLQKRMKLTDEKINRLFSGARIVLKRNLDAVGAEKYVAAMAKMGAMVDVVPPLPPASAAIKAADLTLAPVEVKAETVSEPESVDPYVTATTASASELFCRQCGSALAATAMHCHRCGAAQVQGSKKSRVVAALMAFFLGWIGAHRLYLGQWWGVLYILLYPIMWLVALIEAVVFVCTPAARWNEKYGNVPPGNGVIMAAVGLVGFVFIGGILAAVAVPAYQDYTVRARVSEALIWSGQYRDAAGAFYARLGYLPTSSIEVGEEDGLRLDGVARLEFDNDGNLVLRFDDMAVIENETLIWQADIVDGVPRWRCTGGTLPNKFRPSNCRDEQRPVRSQRSQSAGSEDSTTYRSGDRQVSMTLRGDWEPLAMDGAALSYLNARDDIGVSVVVEGRELFESAMTLDDYHDVLVEYSFGAVTDLQYQFIEARSINGVPAKIFRIDGFIDGTAIMAIAAAAEGGGNFYKISTWTSKVGDERTVDKMLATLYSFKLASVNASRLPARR